MSFERTNPWRVATALVCLLLVGGAAGWLTESGSVRSAAVPSTTDTPTSAPASAADLAPVLDAQDDAIRSFVAHAEHERVMGEIVAFVESVRAEEAELARQEAARRNLESRRPNPSSVSGDCYASDLPDYIVSRESGGNPNAHNPSGAHGCFQIMPGTWNGTCSDLGALNGASVAAQTECANRLWAGGAGSSHWAATR